MWTGFQSCTDSSFVTPSLNFISRRGLGVIDVIGEPTPHKSRVVALFIDFKPFRRNDAKAELRLIRATADFPWEKISELAASMTSLHSVALLFGSVEGLLAIMKEIVPKLGHFREEGKLRFVRAWGSTDEAENQGWFFARWTEEMVKTACDLGPGMYTTLVLARYATCQLI